MQASVSWTWCELQLVVTLSVKWPFPTFYFSHSICNSMPFSLAIFLLFLVETKIIRSTQMEVIVGSDSFHLRTLSRRTVCVKHTQTLIFSPFLTHSFSVSCKHFTFLIQQLEAMSWFSAFERLDPHHSFVHSPSLNSFTMSIWDLTLGVLDCLSSTLGPLHLFSDSKLTAMTYVLPV